MDKLSQTEQATERNIIHVIAPARLHLGFIDMHGGLGREFGSLGVCLSEICTHVSAVPSKDVVIQGPSSHRASLYAGRILEHLDIRHGAEITIHESIPEHAGLGSGTQLSLAVGHAIAELYKKEINTVEIARIMERGSRSGIGVGAFSHGGFIVDGGRGKNTELPPVISHMNFPEAWRFVLVFDTRMQGVHGTTERKVFQNLSPMSELTTQKICRLVLMQILPALAEEECNSFGAAISEIQRMVGDHFAPAQGGRYCSQPVSEVLPWILGQGATGIGQSSWGPTGFALFANETQAYQAVKLAREKWNSNNRLKFKVCKARNQKADINTELSSASKNLKLKNF